MRLKITHKDIMAMVSETINRLGYRTVLNEISTADAFERFYKDKIPTNVYEALMNGAEQMTPLHKLAADHIAKEYANNSRPTAANNLAKVVGNFWNSASNEARQYAVKICKDEADELKKDKTLLYNTIMNLSKMKSHSENSYVERGFEILYEDEKLKVTCTKSYSSSCRHYGASHWCTASDQLGEYDGFEMFQRYTIEDDDILCQFIPKSVPELTCQAQFDTVRNKFGQICNWEDEGITTDQFEKLIKRNCDLDLNAIVSQYITPQAKRLFSETVDIVNDEKFYYEKKKAARLKQLKLTISNALKSQSCTEFAIHTLKDFKSNGGKSSNTYGARNSWRNEDEKWRSFLEIHGGRIYVTVSYKGETEGVRQFQEEYYEDIWWSKEHYGNITWDMTFAFGDDGNVIGKFPGIISVENEFFLFITDIYDDEMNYANLNYVLKAPTAEVMFTNMHSVCDGDCDDYIDELRGNISDAQFKKLFGNYSYDDWWIIYDDKEHAYALSTETGNVVKIPFLEDW